MFCLEPPCSSTFDTVAENNHSFSKTATVINKVEHTFITKWNYCHQFTKPAWQSHVQQFQKNRTALYMKISLVKVQFFRSTFHFNKEQKNCCGSFLWMVNRLGKENTRHTYKFIHYSITNFNIKIMWHVA